MRECKYYPKRCTSPNLSYVTLSQIKTHSNKIHYTAALNSCGRRQGRGWGRGWRNDEPAACLPAATLVVHVELPLRRIRDAIQDLLQPLEVYRLQNPAVDPIADHLLPPLLLKTGRNGKYRDVTSIEAVREAKVCRKRARLL